MKPLDQIRAMLNEPARLADRTPLTVSINGSDPVLVDPGAVYAFVQRASLPPRRTPSSFGVVPVVIEGISVDVSFAVADFFVGVIERRGAPRSGSVGE